MNAKRLGLAPGETLISDPENLFDLAGSYPLEMQVVGVLAPAGTADAVQGEPDRASQLGLVRVGKGLRAIAAHFFTA